ncbi:diacylglycerol/lipid kinase family protein [Arthrobacter sp. TMN-50]
MKLAVAINPAAGAGSAEQAGTSAVEALRAHGHDVVVLVESSYGQLLGLARAAVSGNGVDALIVVGGDGMVRLGATVLAGSAVPLGIVAAGTGNDVARMLGLPLKDPLAAADVIENALLAPPQRMDLGRIGRGAGFGEVHWFAGACSAGFDAVVNARANRWSWPRGKSRYTLALLRELAVFKPISYRLVVDGTAESTTAMLVSVANGRSIGGGMTITPDALRDDGALDLLVVSAISRIRLIAMLPRLFAGTHVSHPAVRIERVRSVTVEVEGVTAFADGEPVGAAPLQIDVVPGALRVLAPATRQQ